MEQGIEATLTTDKTIQADSKNTSPFKQLRMGTTGIYKALEVVL